MPILYICVVNQFNNFVVDSLGTKTSGDFRSQVIKYRDTFETFGRKVIPLDSERTLAY